MEFICNSLGQLPEIAEQILLLNNKTKVFAFYGKMGSGKTTLIRALCSKLKINEQANSPTFAIINEYSLPENLPVYHFDFYRIKNETEAFDLGYEDYFYSGNYCFIEWPEKIESLLPDIYCRIFIEDIDGIRKISAQNDYKAD